MKASEQFRLNADGLTADGYHALEPAAKKAMYISDAITAAILLIIFAILYPRIGDELGWARIAYAAAMMALLALLAVYPGVYYIRYRYRIDDDKVEVRRGVIVITHTLIPIERIHEVTVSVGPVNGLFGLANVEIVTAGGTESIDHLDSGTAESIAARLNDIVVGILKERD
ncbi:MAG: PH domain-containing protein [Candidatus Methanomethylophilus sp.]|jgi:membrane protein YdbS with pleckstrin-like domain|nr:PH domain-containing protein [Methanomethylophilus sp.]MCI2075095.1 PH domain-containing protein [Methanomethylophilus sp.]MCI2092437.1 PH domain-containing protein [Methanomethylophilus sp.]